MILTSLFLFFSSYSVWAENKNSSVIMIKNSENALNTKDGVVIARNGEIVGKLIGKLQYSYKMCTNNKNIKLSDLRNSTFIMRTSNFTSSDAELWAERGVNCSRNSVITHLKLHAEGGLKWNFKSDAVYSTPTLDANGNIFVIALDGRIQSIDPRGILRWSYQTKFSAESSPVIGDDGTVYAGIGYLYAFTNNGRLKWVYKSQGFIDQKPTPPSAGKIYFVADALYAIGLDGNIKWKNDLEKYGPSTFLYPMVSDKEYIYLATIYGDKPSVTVVNSKGEKILSKIYNISSAIRSNDGNTFYFGAKNNQIFALNAFGNEKWHYSSGGKGDIYKPPAIDSNGNLYFITSGKNITSLNSKGSHKWDVKTNESKMFPPIVGLDGRVYSISESGSLYCISTSGLLLWQTQVRSTSGTISPNIYEDGTLYFSTWGGISAIYTLSKGVQNGSQP